jgi:hypothetical protein
MNYGGIKDNAIPTRMEEVDNIVKEHSNDYISMERSRFLHQDILDLLNNELIDVGYFFGSANNNDNTYQDHMIIELIHSILSGG